jgi:L-fuconolactonase
MGYDIIRQTYAKFKRELSCMGLLIDAHIHFWDPAARHHDWLQAVPALSRRFEPSDIEFGATVPDGLVFVEADRAPDEVLSEVDWVSSLHSSSAVPVVGIVAHAPLEQGAGVEPLLRQLVERPAVVGVRRLLQHQPAALLDDPALVEGTRLLAEYGLASDLCVTHDQLPAVIRLVRSCPDTTFVLDHLGKPPLVDRHTGLWGEDLRRLARYANVSCKLSGLATIAPADSRRPDLLAHLRHALHAFGPGRCLFGSDWPVSLQSIGYQGWLDVVSEAIHDLDTRQRAAVLGENAVRVYGLGIPNEVRRANARS